DARAWARVSGALGKPFRGPRRRGRVRGEDALGGEPGLSRRAAHPRPQARRWGRRSILAGAPAPPLVARPLARRAARVALRRHGDAHSAPGLLRLPGRRSNVLAAHRLRRELKGYAAEGRTSTSRTPRYERLRAGD